MSGELVAAAEVAAGAVSVLSPYLTEAGKEAAKAAGKELAGQGFKLLGWLRGKLTGPAADALTALEEKPERESRQGVLKLQLGEFLEDNPALLDELRAMLKEQTPQGQSLVLKVDGDYNDAVQLGNGSNNNTVTITRR